ncbi:calcium-independent phospholipase A2-gamma isoform X1 [Frankliniella occidentalis]|uniref:Calcium-independent phospholipase A2-gamma isoform X1 n=2 Tax=Frankliniella occidentalis TaxID=133901 RepID=A0A6J1TDG5_FRAOC|nr:calcium-independent phospholipase A2-gamma isoform X1 [Frankliniella occidentalis]
MSFSKNIRQCQRCVCLTPRRQLNFQSASPLRLRPSRTQGDKMPAAQLRALSATQWKLLAQLREYLTKGSEKGYVFNLTKEWMSLLQRLPSLRFSSPPEKNLKDNATHTLTSSSTSSSVTSGSAGSALDITSQINATSRTPGNSPPSPPSSSSTPVSDPSSSKYSHVFANLKLFAGNGNGEEGKSPGDAIQEKSKWRTQKETVSKHTVHSRTQHVISAVASAVSVQSRLKRLEDLLEHFYRFPESKMYAGKEGAVNVLLRVRNEAKDEPTIAISREILTILGYVDPVPGPGIRVLSIDGGGIRGVLVIEMLKKLEELTGKRVYEMFDYICGVSTGAILSCVLGPQRISLDEVSQRYKELSTKIFTQNPIWGTSNLVWSHAYYDTTMWEDMLRTYVGDTKLIHTSRDSNCPKFSAVSTVVNRERVSAFVFRNYELQHRIQSQYLGSSQHAAWEAVRASSSAPTYFEEFKLGDLLHQDGGIMVNNPTAVAIHEARLLWPGVPLQCVVSFGTGRCNPVTVKSENAEAAKGSSWRNKFNKILDSATDTEAVHTLLNDLMPGNVYYRFNPYLTEMVTMTEIRPEKISQLEMDAEMYYRRNEEKFKEAAQTLVQQKNAAQKTLDWVNLQAKLVGLRSNL